MTGDHPGRAFRIDHSHAGFPQGSLTRRFSSYLVSYWLTNAIDRIVKETPHATKVAPDQHAHTTCGGDASLHPPTPSAGARLRLAARPGRRLRWLLAKQRLILTRNLRGQLPSPGFLRSRYASNQRLVSGPRTRESTVHVAEAGGKAIVDSDSAMFDHHGETRRSRRKSADPTAD